MEKINQNKSSRNEQMERIKNVVDSAIEALPNNVMESILDKRELKNNLKSIQREPIRDLIRTQRLRSKLLGKREQWV